MPRSHPLTRPLVLALLLAGTVTALAAFPAAAAPPDPDAPGLTTSERFAALLARVKVEQSGMRSLEARFVQRKESEMFVAAEEARGMFSYLAPDRVRWEFTSPNPMTVVIDDDSMTTWYRDLGRAEEVSVGRYSGQVLKYLGASGSMDTLLDYFRVRVAFPKDPAEPYRMTLLPRYARIAKRIETMQVWIDREHFVPVRMRYVEPGGDVTEYRFTDIELNAAIPPERFELDLPPGVKRHKVGSDRKSE